MRGLKDMSVVVTGGGSGIGRAICQRLGEEGASVAVLDLNLEGARETVELIDAAGGRGEAYEVDIVDRSAVLKAVDLWEAAAGPIGGLVNNAGWDKAVSFLDSDPELWRKVIDINLYGLLNVTHAVLSKMAAQGKGRVVSIASDAGRVGSSGESVYSACKGGTIALSKTLARELSRTGITVNTVCPGPTDTPLLAGFDPSGRLKEALAKAIPMRRLGQPADYPGIVTFLLSEDAGFITGQTISVSGGLSMAG
ncbi:MAG: SDR family oxidoreductase [Alphaproteobacteria bacterium]